MRSPRKDHASVAIDSVAYVYGGVLKDCLGSMERLALEQETDWQGSVKSRQWVLFDLPEVLPRHSILMAAINHQAILILGGA